MKKSILTLLVCCLFLTGLNVDLYGDNKQVLVENGIEYSLSSQRDTDNQLEEVRIIFYTKEAYSILSVTTKNKVATKLSDLNYHLSLPEGIHSIEVEYFDGSSTQIVNFDIHVNTFNNASIRSSSASSYLTVTKSVNEVSTGSTVIFKVQVRVLADDYDTYRLQVHTPNKYNPTIVGNNLKELKLPEYPNDFIKVGTFTRSETGGVTEVNFDVMVNTNAALTPHLHQMNVDFRLVNSSNQVVELISHSVVQKVSSFSIVPKAKVVGVAYFNEASLQSSKPVIGMANSLGSKVTHSNSSFLTPVHYRFDMITDSNVVQGIRSFQSITAEYTLPDGAVFNPLLANNNKWVLSGDGKKVVQTSNISASFQKLMNGGKAGVAQSVRQDILYDLVLLYPNYDTTKPIELNMDVKFVPTSDSSELSSDANDPIYKINKKLTFNGSVSAYSNPFDSISMTLRSNSNRFYDSPLSTAQFISSWSLELKNITQERFEIESLGKLDENGKNLGTSGVYYRVPISEFMKLTKVTIQPTSTVLSSDFVFSYKKADGNIVSLDVALNSNVQEIAFNDHIVDFTITPKNGSSLYLNGNKTLYLEMDFIIIDPTKAIKESIPDKTKLVSLQNAVKLKGKYVDASYTPLGKAIDVEDKKHLSAAIPDNNFTATFSVLDSSSGILTTAVTGTKATLSNSFNFSTGVIGTTIKGLTIVNIFPQGLDVDPSNISLTTSSQHTTFLDKPLTIKESQIIRNYKSTGKTAVIIKLNDVTLVKDVVNLTSVNPKVEISFSNYANIQTSLENYIYIASNSDYQLNQSGSGYVLDSTAISGDSSRYVFKNMINVTYSPPKELVKITSGSGSMDNGIQINGKDNVSRTELNKTTTLNITLNNNFEKNNPEGVFENIRILGLVPKVNNRVSLNGSSYDTVNTSLIAMLENAKDNNSHNHMFDVYYTYKAFKNTNQTSITELQTNASSFLNGLLSEDLISANTRSIIDYDKVTAVVLIQKPGTKFESDNRMSFDMKIRVDDYNVSNPQESYFGSSFFVSTVPQLASMANLTKTTVESYEVSGRAYFDVDKNNTFNVGDKVLSNHVVEIQNIDSSSDLPAIVTTDSEGKYSFRTFISGSYSVTFLNPSHFNAHYKVNNTLNLSTANIRLDINNNDQTVDVLMSLKDNVIALNQSMLDYDGLPFSNTSHVSINYELSINGNPYSGIAFDESFNPITITNGKFTLQENGNITIPAVSSGSTYVISTSDTIYNFSQKSGVVNGNISLGLVHQVKSKEVVVNTTWNGLSPYDYGFTLIGKNAQYNKSESLTVDGLSMNYGFRPLTDIYGEEIVYSIDIEKIVGVRSEYSLSDITIFDITQTQLRDISVSLDWIGGDISSHVSSVSLYANGVYLNTKSNINDRYTWQDMPVNDDNGNPIVYSITQAPLASYDSVIQGFNITNSLVQNIDVSIQWIGSGPAQEKSIVRLLRDGQVIDNQEVINKTTYTFLRLPVYDSSGLEHQYTIEYVPINGFRTEIKDFTITNYAIQDIVVTTQWLGLKDNLPDTTISLYRDGHFITSQTAIPGTPTVVQSLDITNSSGEAYLYTVTQSAVLGYKTNVNGFNIVNIPLSPLTINIEWVGGPSVKPDSVITILKNGTPFMTEIVKGIHQVSLVDFEMYDELDKAIIYTVSQTPIPNYSSLINGYTITNIYASPLTDITASIKWIGITSNFPNTYISLLRKVSGSISKVRIQNEYEVVFSDVLIKGGNSEHTWENLPIYNSDGLLYEYSLSQLPLNGFTTKVDNLTITNTFIKTSGDNDVDSLKPKPGDQNTNKPIVDGGIPTDQSVDQNDKENENGSNTNDKVPSLPMTGMASMTYSYLLMVFLGIVILMRKSSLLGLNIFERTYRENQKE